MRQVFLDHQSATPVLPEVFEAMAPYFCERFGNAGSFHRLGLQARDALEAARGQAAGLIRAESAEEIIFTSGATESANLAVKGVAFGNQRRGNHLVVSAAEHVSVLGSVEWLEKQGFEVTRVPVDGEGRVEAGRVAEALTEKTVLVCVQHANHEIGTVQPIEEISGVTQERGIPLFVDASASAGWIPIDVGGSGISLLSFAPHRFYGPKGVGVLYRNRRARMVALAHGGTQEGGRRAGTENIPAIVGGGLAAEIAGREMGRRMELAGHLQGRLWEGIRSRVPLLRLNGPGLGEGRLVTNLNVSAEFTEGEGQVLRLDLSGIAVASGSSCLGKSLKTSHVLKAIGLPHSLAQASILVSLGEGNTEEEIDYFIEVYEKVVAKLRELSPAWEEYQEGLVESVIGAGRPGGAGI